MKTQTIEGMVEFGESKEEAIINLGDFGPLFFYLRGKNNERRILQRTSAEFVQEKNG